jgi:hypothetical protein
MLSRWLSIVALAALTGCAETPVTPVPSGTISGHATVQGRAATGLTVTLSNGKTAMVDEAGEYKFADVPLGSYTLYISNAPVGTTWVVTKKSADLTAPNQSVTVDFTGASQL